MAREIATRLRQPGVDCLVEVFGGSAAVMLNAGFQKRVYNDADNSIVNVFRVIADQQKCAALVRYLDMMPPSRTIFNACDYPPQGNEIERAAKTLYRQIFCFGGKGRAGGFSVSIADRADIKEVSRYRGVIARMDQFVDFFHNTMIECLDYQECVRIYGRKENAVLFCDPPYVGTEKYYRVGSFGTWDHWNMAQMLNDVPAHVVLTYYDDPKLRELYPEAKWNWESVECTKNARNPRAAKQVVSEFIISKRR
jgi:DNA adenine methylase